MMVRKRTHGGFTLLEIIIAVSIFGVISSIIFPAMIQFLDAREKIEARLDRIGELQRTFSLLDRDLRFLVNRPFKDEYGERDKKTFYVNDEDSLLTMSVLTRDAAIPSLAVPKKVVWQLENGHLTRIQYPVLDPDRDTPASAMHLLDDVKDLRFELRKIDGEKVEKTTKWKSEDSLPDSMIVSILLDDDRRYDRVIVMTGAKKADNTNTVGN